MKYYLIGIAYDGFNQMQGNSGNVWDQSETFDNKEVALKAFHERLRIIRKWLNDDYFKDVWHFVVTLIDENDNEVAGYTFTL